MQEETLLKPEAPQGGSKFFTFNLNTVLGLVAIAGMIVLFILYFTDKKADTGSVPVTMQKSGKPLSVVYVNLDSLNTHYEYVKVLRTDLEGTGKRLQTEVLSEQKSLEKEAADFQRQVASNAISEEKAKTVYESLMQKQQALMEKKDRYTQQVAEQEMGMNLRLIDTVTNFLKRYNRKYGYDYIMGFKAGGEILISNDTLDITRDVLQVINKEYQERKK